VSHDHVQGVLEQWRRELPKLDRAPMAVIGRISRLSQLLQDEVEPVFARYGLNGGEFDVLAALRRSGKPYQLTPSELSRSLMVTSGGMTKRLRALEERRLVTRTGDPRDARSKQVTLTPEGVRVTEEAVAAHTANEARLLAGLSKARRAELAALLEELALSLGDEMRATQGRSRR
jgi:DNA-binding MarR family transcriptional regulator